MASNMSNLTRDVILVNFYKSRYTRHMHHFCLCLAIVGADYFNYSSSPMWSFYEIIFPIKQQSCLIQNRSFIHSSTTPEKIVVNSVLSLLYITILTQSLVPLHNTLTVYETLSFSILTNSSTGTCSRHTHESWSIVWRLRDSKKTCSWNLNVSK